MKEYDTVVGLEIHVELKTETKIFCSCSTRFGAPPNTLCCPVCTAQAGALPSLNKKAVELAVRAGSALGCEISELSRFDRKNYFYPDSPKAYQITQFFEPVCKNGELEINTSDGTKKVRIKQIHLEEDAGKLIHGEKSTYVDLNRCGVPLIEIVTEPDIRSAEEAKSFLKKLRGLLVFAEVSDCKMNEGSMRCDVNLSVMPHGSESFGTRTEIKNINSVSFVAKAIEAEATRQISELEEGKTIIRETRRFDSARSKTYSMRTKEDADDYRYFPEPDLPPLFLSRQEIDRIRADIPRSQSERSLEYKEKYMLNDYECGIITEDLALSDYFESCAEVCKSPRKLISLILGELLRLQESSDFHCDISPSHLASLAELWDCGRINSTVAKSLLCEMWEHDLDPALAVAERFGENISGEDKLRELVKNTLSAMPEAVADYKRGKKAAAKAVIGKIMKETKGAANPKLLGEILENELSSF